MHARPTATATAAMQVSEGYATKRKPPEVRDTLAIGGIGVGPEFGMRVLGIVVWRGMQPQNRAQRRALARLERRRIKQK